MTAAGFLADLRANLIRGDGALEQRLQLDAWVYGPGRPDNAAAPDPAAFVLVDGAARCSTPAGGERGALLGVELGGAGALSCKPCLRSCP